MIIISVRSNTVKEILERPNALNYVIGKMACACVTRGNLVKSTEV